MSIPEVIKNILFRAGAQHEIRLRWWPNKLLQVPPSYFILTPCRVTADFDVADNKIIKCGGAGDLVMIANIPLVAEVLTKGALSLNPCSEPYQQTIIREKLTLWDLWTYFAAARNTRNFRVNWIDGCIRFARDEI